MYIHSALIQSYTQLNVLVTGSTQMYFFFSKVERLLFKNSVCQFTINESLVVSSLFQPDGIAVPDLCVYKPMLKFILIQ